MAVTKARKTIKREIAERDVKNKKASVLRQKLRDRQVAIEDLKAKHQSAVEPLQVEMERLVEAEVDALCEKKKPDEKNLARQSEITETILKLDGDLGSDLDKLKLEIGSLERDVRKITEETARLGSLENDLANSASEALQVRSFILEQEMEFLLARTRRAKERVDENTHGLSEAQDREHESHIQLHKKRLVKWEAELAECHQLRTGLEKRMAENHQAKLSE